MQATQPHAAALCPQAQAAQHRAHWAADAAPAAKCAAVDMYGSKLDFQRGSQAPGASPSSETSCAMDYSCSLPATPQAAAQQPAGLAHAGSGCDEAGAWEGWFAKCRGCGCMTAHEQVIRGADVPFCRRCQATLAGACPGMQTKMLDTLLYVHHAWSNAGL